MKDQYVILTGSKNNAGDFLIKDRAKDLLTWLRPDRTVVDKDGWKPFDRHVLDQVNESRALILLGGPALQEKMRPRVYGLVEDLDEIKVPIITMGIGWYSANGAWKDTHYYPLNQLSCELLYRIEKSGYLSSVRDYHTLNVLQFLGLKNYLMTGCPALYSQKHIGSSMNVSPTVSKVGFSLGVSMKTSERMFRQMQDVVLNLRDTLASASLVVAFHHGLNGGYLHSHGSTPSLDKAQQRFCSWLIANGIEFEDISGSAESLKKFYSGCDLHIGYRVHAHIFMCSISKPSILICEDGRGKALSEVLGGVMFDGYDLVNNSIVVKILHKLQLPYDNFTPVNKIAVDVAQSIAYELHGGVRLNLPREAINRHFSVMKRFVEQLP